MSGQVKQMCAAPQPMKVTARYLHQNAKVAIQDIYDALVELITNADDRYEVLGRHGEIEIEIERKRKGTPSLLRVRDFADGMTIGVMEQKLHQLGGRVSGMAQGERVRGTNSRGAKDVAVLGGAIFESIAEDGRYHKCEITNRIEFIAYGPSVKVTSSRRRALKIPKGTGTVVTIGVDPVYKVPQHNHLRRKLRSLVALRDILGSRGRRLVLRDINQGREDVIDPLAMEGKTVVKERFIVPGYAQAEAKLVIKRSARRLEDRKSKFRRGGILVKSRHGIHEATYFAPELENDPHAAWFFGRVTCQFIDDLWNDYDERFEKNLPPTDDNPCPIVDPHRKAGLRRDHPFTIALRQGVLKHLRPLVEAERKREEKARVRIESEQTRERLGKLERAAAKFMQEHLIESDVAREPDAKHAQSTFVRDGYTLNPPFAQIIKGHSCRFWLNIRQETFPEVSVGDSVEIHCLTDEIRSSLPYTQLEAHPSQGGLLRSVWLVKGEKPTKATGIRVRVGSIVAERVVEVLESERDKYTYVKELCFSRKRYSVVVGKGKAVHILAPYPSLVARPTPVEILCSDRSFTVTGARVLAPRSDWGVAVCNLHIKAEEPEHHGTLEARVAGHVAKAEVTSVLRMGSPIKISVENQDFGNQRYLWQSNVLKIAARHPSVHRYLGPPPFTAQEEKHFRVLLAEIVAEAVCQRTLGSMVDQNPEEWQEADWDAFYATYCKLMTEFLPIAHTLQVRDP